MRGFLAAGWFSRIRPRTCILREHLQSRRSSLTWIEESFAINKWYILKQMNYAYGHDAFRLLGWGQTRGQDNCRETWRYILYKVWMRCFCVSGLMSFSGSSRDLSTCGIAVDGPNCSASMCSRLSYRPPSPWASKKGTAKGQVLEHLPLPFCTCLVFMF